MSTFVNMASTGLAHHLRETLASLSGQVRTELVAVIDDAFEVAPDVVAARRQAHRLLRDPAAQEVAKAHRLGYPIPSPTEAPAAAVSDVGSLRMLGVAAS